MIGLITHMAGFDYYYLNSNQQSQAIMAEEPTSVENFIKFLREKEAAIRNKLVEKRNESINKLEENERRLLMIIPKEILDMTAGDFLERHDGELDDIMMGAKVLSTLVKPENEVKNEIVERNAEMRYSSPPKKSFKKVIIKKVK